nr:lactate dehydrogenase/glycoside hydrolase, family 4, C-terminal [Tanacetum cinerariifolium]
MAISQTILTQDIADEIALVDVIADKLRGKMLDLRHAAAFFPHTTISASVDYSSTVGSDLVIVTARARQIPGESRLNLVQGTCLCFPWLFRLSQRL